MSLPITIPYTFANATTSIPLSQLDSDFTTVVNAINGIGNGTNSLSNATIVATGSNTARTLAARSAQVVNVKDFGALGTNVSSNDDGPAIQAAYNYLVSIGGGTLFFPAGTYYTTQTLVFSSSNIPTHIQGVDMYAVTIILNSSSSIPVFNLSTSTYDGSYFFVENIGITTAGSGANLAGNTGFVVSNRGFTSFFRVSILYTYVGMNFVNSFAPRINQCLIVNTSSSGIYSNDLSFNNAIVRDCGFFGNGITAANGAAISIVGPASTEAMVIQGNDMEGNYIAILIENTTSLSILGNYIESSTSTNFYIYTPNYSMTIEGNWFGASPTSVIQNVTGLRFQNNTIYNTTINVDVGNTALDTIVAGNKLLGTGSLSPAQCAISDFQSTIRGVRFPNMTTTQKNAISSPLAGLVVFDTTLSKLCIYTGSAWQTITSA